MKKCLLIFIFLSVGIVSFSQNTIAILKYEQAEESFEKGDYKATIIYLDEAKKILGQSNPKILFLKIMAEEKLISLGGFDFEFLSQTRLDVREYLQKNMDNTALSEKVKDVYLFSEKLAKFPATLFDWNKKEEIKIQEEIKKKEAAELVKKQNELKQIENERLLKLKKAEIKKFGFGSIGYFGSMNAPVGFHGWFSNGNGKKGKIGLGFRFNFNTYDVTEESPNIAVSYQQQTLPQIVGLITYARPILYPVYVYAGAGVSSFGKYYKNVNNDWVLVEESDKIDFVSELGIFIKVGKTFILQGGYSNTLSNFKELTLGLSIVM